MERLLAVSTDAERWDAQAEYDIGQLMRHYLRDHPPSSGSECSRDFADWSERLVGDGQARLWELGERRLRVL